MNDLGSELRPEIQLVPELIDPNFNGSWLLEPKIQVQPDYSGLLYTAKLESNSAIINFINLNSKDYNIYLSNDTNCDIINYAICTNAQMEIIPANS